tara:strand:+ start:81 stop:509 length:429 start_codon:yes stop_codon:yes gene_type:complete
MESYLGLFLSALLAATVVPFSSEVLLAAMVVSGKFQITSLFLYASAGNILGSVINWGLGRYCLHWQDKRWFPISRAQLEKASYYFNHYGVFSLLLAWVPVIGDPITFAAGVFKTRFWLFLVLVSVSKAGRYFVLLNLLDLVR